MFGFHAPNGLSVELNPYLSFFVIVVLRLRLICSRLLHRSFKLSPRVMILYNERNNCAILLAPKYELIHLYLNLHIHVHVFVNSWCVSNIKSILSIIRHAMYRAVCVQLTHIIAMIVKMRVLYVIIIIKSEVWIISHCLWWGHESTVFAICLAIWKYISSVKCESVCHVIKLKIYQTVNNSALAYIMTLRQNRRHATTGTSHGPDNWRRFVSRGPFTNTV